MRNPYDVLGVPRTASDADIKKAFRKLAKRWHPDRNANDPSAQAKFAEINTAYEIVGEKEKRAQFDRGEIDAEGRPRATGFEGFTRQQGNPFGAGAGARRGGPGSADAFAAEDVLREFFGSSFGRASDGPGRRGGRAPGRKGEDLALTAEVRIEDLVAGGKARLAMPTGRTLEVNIPAGMEPGKQIRLKGQGLPGENGGAAGDALITVVPAPHPLFRVDEANLRLDLPVGLDEAILGARVRVPTPDGAVEMTIPAGTTGAQTLRLKGRGLPAAGGRGDLFVTPRIVLTDPADQDLANLARRRREAAAPSPRGPEFG